jgi:aldehyde dehydrogenase (NAD+)
MIYINGGSVCAESHLPFGGVKKSGNGCKSAAGTYKAVTDEVAVTVNFEKGMTWAQGLK